MKVYYFTIFVVVFFSWMAQSTDHPFRSRHNELKIRHSRITSLFFFFVILTLVLVAGLRYKVGVDYSAYYKSINVYADSLAQSALTLNEPGFPLIARISIMINEDPATAIFLASLLTIWPALRIIYRYTDRLLLASLLFVFLGCWHGSFNGIRQYLAATMLFCGYRYLVSKKFIKYAFFVFLAFLFHRSVVVMIMLFFAVHRKYNARNLVFIIIASIIVLNLYDRLFAIAGWITESNYSLEDEYSNHVVNTLRVLSACTPAVCFSILYWNKKKGPRDNVYLYFLLIHAAIRVATMRSALLYRVGIYTSLFQTIAIPELVKQLNPTIRRLITFFMVSLLAIQWWYELFHGGQTTFQWIWNR